MLSRSLSAGLGIACLIAAMIAAPYVLSPYDISLLTLVVVAALLAVSVNMLAGELALMSLGQGGIAAASAYAVAWAAREGHGTSQQLLLALAITLAISALYAVMSLRTTGIYFLMVTLALGMVVFGLAYRMSSITGGENGIVGVDRPGPISQSWQFFYVASAALIVAMATWAVVRRSPFGLVLRGIRESESRMRSFGYRIEAYKFVAIMMSGGVAGVAGVLAVWHSEFVSPSAAGFHRSALVVVMVILGGVGTAFGPLVGAALVVWTEQVLSTHFDRWPTALGLLLVVVILWAPGGIVGGVRALADVFPRLGPLRSRAADDRNQPTNTPDPELVKPPKERAS